MSSRVVVIGATYLDMMFDVTGAPAERQILFARRGKVMLGGKGLNQAVAAKRLGADVTLITSLGTDQVSDMAFTWLINEGFERPDLRIETHQGFDLTPSVILTEDNDVRGVVGPFDEMPPAPLEEMLRADTRIAEANVVLVSYDFGTALVSELANLVASIKHDRRPVMICNPAPIRSGEQVDLAALRAFDWLVPNRAEAHHLIPDISDDWRLARELCLAIEADVALTLGESGYMHASLQGSEARVVHGAPHNVPTVDATAASDAFCGALAVWIADGRDSAVALRAANAAGAIATTSFGTSSAMPRRSELDSLLALRPGASLHERAD